MLNKVPEITVYFWVIKVLCTTVGETFADNLNENLGLGLSGTSYIMGALLIGVLAFQFRAKKYVPGIYWLAVVLISVVGTLVSDNLVENYGVTLQTTTIAFSAILIAVFAGWYAFERTLSVHTIFTTRREAFYWLAILFTFALGTSAGDFLSEQLELGYLAALGIFAGGSSSSPCFISAGPVELVALSGDGSVELHVRDHGPGFPVDFRERAFERFSRAETSRGQDGSGLGLAIVEAIARAHGGEAHVENRDEGGADAWLTLISISSSPATI